MNEKLDNQMDNIRQMFQNYMYFLIVAVMSVVYIFYGLLTIETTGKTIVQIIRDGAINLIFGWLIGKMLSMQGYSDGGRHKYLEKTREEYNAKKAEINSIVDRLEDFVKIRNAQDLKEYQTIVLTSEALKYSDFEAGKFADYRSEEAKTKYNKHQLKAIYRCYHPKLKQLNSSDIITGENLNYKSQNDMGETQKENEKKSDIKAFGSRIAFALFFGYFGVSLLNGFDWGNVIWTTIQAVTFLASGLMRYYNSFVFMKEGMVERYRKQMHLLDIFEQWDKHNPRPNEVTEGNIND